MIKKTIDMTWENAYYMYLRLEGFFGHLFTGIFFTMYVSNECDICFRADPLWFATLYRAGF